MVDQMGDLFAGLDGLTFRRRSLRQAAIDASLIQQGVFDTPVRSKPKRRSAKTGSAGGKPRTGGKPKTGARLIYTSLEDEWKKRKPARAGGGGGVAPASRSKPSGAKPSSAPSAALKKSPAGILSARVKIASESQAAVVKIASYAAGGSRVRALVQYQSRGGELALEREDGSTIEGAGELTALATEWTKEAPGREPTKDVLRLVLDFESDQFRGRGGQIQIQTALRQALPGHRVAWASEDRPDGTTRVEIVMSAAARRQGDDAKAVRIFDNRKSLSQLEGRLDRAFGTETHMDVRGFAHGVEGTVRYLTQMTRGGTRAVQSMRLVKDGRFTVATTLIGHDANLKEARDWKRDLRSREQRDVAHIILSAKPGTDKEAFVEAARAMLAREFAGHKYAFALHEDKEHIHVHAVVKMRAENGERLDPKIQDLQRWRETLAHEARERHIPMEAVSRFERANPPGYKLKDIRRVERGVAPEHVRRRVEAVRSGTPHIPVREEGKRRANAALQGWREVEAIAASRSFEPALAAGATRLYRADRPGAALTSEPLFTRDRNTATRMAERSGGSVSYIDVSPAELATLKPSRADVINQFVVSPELASTRKPLDQPSPATILKFRNRAEQAVAGAALRETSRQPETTGVKTDMPNLETMQSAFDDINQQMKVVEETLPLELLPQVETVRKKMGETQRNMLNAQQNIERKRGAVEGGRYVEPVPKNDLAGFVSEKRGETIRYSHLSKDGEIGKVAFVDNGRQVEIHDWKDREAVLAAMQVSAEKWGDLTVTGTASYKALVVELAAEHGFQIANPELQDRIKRETARLERVRAERPGFSAGDVQRPVENPIPAEGQPVAASQAPPEPKSEDKTQAVAGGEVPVQAQPPAFTDTGSMVKINDRKDREAVRAAMEEASKKWNEITVTGTARDKNLAVSVAAEHGFKIANPELQEKLAAETARFEGERAKEAARLQRQNAKVPGFVDGSEKQTALADTAEPQNLNSQMPPAHAVQAVVRPDHVAGVKGMLVETGNAKFAADKSADKSESAELTPYAALQLEDGRIHRLWGASLPATLERAGAAIGDTISLQKNGTETVVKPVPVTDEKTGQTHIENRQVERNVWAVAIHERAGTQVEASQQAQAPAKAAAPNAAGPASPQGPQMPEGEFSRAVQAEIGRLKAEGYSKAYISERSFEIEDVIRERYAEAMHKLQSQKPAGEQDGPAGLHRSGAETSIALDTVRTKTENEASRETGQAVESTRTNEKPIDGGGSDHAYRTQAEAGAARRAQNAVEMDPKRPMPTDINQSPQVERLAQEQAELLKQKQQETERAQTQKNVHRQRQ